MRRYLAFLVMALFLVAVPGEAATFVALTDAELVGGAETIVQGRVMSLETMRTPSGRMVVTEAVIRVQSVIAGEAPSRITVRTVGGQLGDMRFEAPGFPQFNADEHVILFLEPEPAAPARMKVRGYQQGHFEIVERNDGVRLAVPRIEEGTRLVTRDGRVLPEPRSQRLGVFKRNLRRLVEEHRPQR